MFRKMNLGDVSWINECIEYSQVISCDYSTFNLYAWCETYGTEIDNICGCFAGRLFIDGRWVYLFPCGKGDIREAVRMIVHNHEENYDYPITFMGNKLQEQYLVGEYSSILPDGYEDYVYSALDLAELKGQKYHSKRNLISQFNRKYNWKFESLDANNIESAKKVMKVWHEQTAGDSYEEELFLLETAVDNTELFNIIGGIIYVDNEPVAMSVGSFLRTGLFNVHIEKADTSYTGVYAKIMNEMAVFALSQEEINLINREEDMAIENLKKAKLSLHPIHMEKKYLYTKM